MKGRSILTLIIALNVSSSVIEGAFQQSSLSVSAKGMGGAFVALANDSSALFINPAGLLNVPYHEASFSYGKPFYGLAGIDLSQGYFSVSVPMYSGARLGIGGASFVASGLMEESVWSVAYARNIGSLLGLGPQSLQMGINLNYLFHSFSIREVPEGVVFKNGTSRDAWSADAGILLHAGERLSLGASMRHITQPDVGLITNDPVPRETRLGLALKQGRLTFVSDAKHRNNGLGAGNSSWSYHAGLVASMPASPLSLRLGGNTNREVSTGFSLSYQQISLIYAYSVNRDLAQDNLGSHFFSLNFHW